MAGTDAAKITIPLTTAEVAKTFGVTASCLLMAIRNGRFDPPGKNTSGCYLWLPADVERARVGMATDRRKQRKAVPA
jgi:hypothetical protein